MKKVLNLRSMKRLTAWLLCMVMIVAAAIPSAFAQDSSEGDEPETEPTVIDFTETNQELVQALYTAVRDNDNKKFYDFYFIVSDSSAKVTDNIIITAYSLDKSVDDDETMFLINSEVIEQDSLTITEPCNENGNVLEIKARVSVEDIYMCGIIIDEGSYTTADGANPKIVKYCSYICAPRTVRSKDVSSKNIFTSDICCPKTEITFDFEPGDYYKDYITYELSGDSIAQIADGNKIVFSGIGTVTVTVVMGGFSKWSFDLKVKNESELLKKHFCDITLNGLRESLEVAFLGGAAFSGLAVFMPPFPILLFPILLVIFTPVCFVVGIGMSIATPIVALLDVISLAK